MAQIARTDFSSAIQAIAQERGLDPDIILDTIKQAVLAAYRRDAREQGEDATEKLLDADIDSQTGEFKVFTWEEGKEDERVDITPPGFGRIAAQTAKQVILQKIREAEKDAIMAQYQDRIGTLISGTVLRFDGPNVRVDIGRTEAIMPPTERIQSERLNLNQRLTFLLKEIKDSEHGKELILSRADTEIVKKLFAREVPEIGSGAVEIKAISRDPGSRTKVAVASSQSGVDPVGSCVGQKGVRVQAVINELGGEKIDVISWSDDEKELLSASLSPAEVISVSLNEATKEATVKVPETQLSLAIGKEGQNVRLAGQLTNWKIEIVGVPVPGQPTTDETPKEAVLEETVDEANAAVTDDTQAAAPADDVKSEADASEEVAEETPAEAEPEITEEPSEEVTEESQEENEPAEETESAPDENAK